MSRCLEFGDWADAAGGELSGRDGFRAAEHLLECSSCRRALLDARRLVECLAPAAPTAGTGALEHARHEDLAALAAAISRREFPSEAWSCEGCSEILLSSIDSTAAVSPEAHHPSASGASRGIDRFRIAPATSRRGRARFWIAGSLAVAAAAAFAFVALSPPSQAWARTAGLRRGQLWFLPNQVAEEVRRVASGGALSPPRFTLPSAPIEVERDPQLKPSAPRVLSPRWEMSEEVRPEFRWSGSGGRAEVFVLDGDRKYLWSAKSDHEERMQFPTTAAPLVRGKTYYWKVNFLDEEGVRPSAYAGFMVLAEDEARRCREDLDRSGASRFVEAVVSERCGLYTRAAEAFDAASQSIAEPEVATRLARELRRRQGLDDVAGLR